MNKSPVFCSALPEKVSFFSSSPELSNKQRFEYFTRTIPSDHHQVMAIVQMIRFLKWSYISILYEESTYGIKVNTSADLHNVGARVLLLLFYEANSVSTHKRIQRGM